MTGDTRPVAYDLLGVGFGPSNLALCAMFESQRSRLGWSTKTVGFVESKRRFAWHPEMMLDGARMQIAFLKDLVTLKDPTSPYTFINYLHEKGRLSDFINLRTFYPTREEYNDYFAWAAEKLIEYVTYSHEAEALHPIVDVDGKVGRLAVTCRDLESGEQREFTTQNLVLSLGGRPAVPQSVAPEVLGPRAFHSSSFLSRIRGFDCRTDYSYDFLVVGAGQSAAEVFLYLAREYPSARVTLAFRGFCLMPANNSPLANEIFHPEMVDVFYLLPDVGKRTVMSTLWTTNYAGVDDQDIDAIVALLYDQRIRGGDRLQIQNFQELMQCTPEDQLVRTVLKNVYTDEVTIARFDAVIFATGYDFAHTGGLLAELEPYINRAEDGAIQLRRDYSVVSEGSLEAKIFLQGATEHTHGLTSTLISVLPHRVSEILESAFDARQQEFDIDGSAPKESSARGRRGPHYRARSVMT
jgi:L-ornithine N5-monooxygenase